MKLYRFLLSLTVIAAAPAADEKFPPMPPVKALPPAEAVKSFQLPVGYEMQLVVGEPVIKEPVVTVFDGNGRMFVAEMRTYMRDIDGRDENLRTSRISMHVSTKGDGNFDKHTVFADGLLLPRMILPLGKGQILINETHTQDILLLTDTDDDGVADRKELWFEGGSRSGNMEHQPSGLIWALDNSLYMTMTNYRLRWTPEGVKKEETKSNGGQWGVNQDDNGNLYFVNASGERGPTTFQAPQVYGTFNPPGQFLDGFKEVFPAAGLRDFQGGLSRVREPQGTLNGFTGGAGIEVYRGDQLPGELLGNVFFGEPVGRLMRRSVVTRDGALKRLSNPYQTQQGEFLRSTDPCFRPLNFTNAPDGTLYITDMYRGIIQQAAWVKEGSYLRKVVQQYQLDKVTGHGRVWRLVHDSTKPVKQPRMYEETAAELTAHLSHPNGWWRDTAQRLLVLGQDKSVVPLLDKMARSHANPLARIHALWTLQGLDAVTAELVRAKMADAESKVRANAIRVSETLFRQGDATFQADIERLMRDPDSTVVLQALMTAKYLAWPDHLKKLTEVVAAGSADRGIKEIGAYLTLPPGKSLMKYSDKQKETLKKGAEIYSTLCTACHGANGMGVEIAGLEGAMIAPPLGGSKTVNNNPKGGIYTLLHGMQGEVDGKKYEGLMIPMAENSDEWIAAILSYVRTSFGNKGTFISPADVAQARRDTTGRSTPWTYQELQDHLPKLIPPSRMKPSASEKNGDARRAIDGDVENRYTTGKFMEPGMWFQVELDKETSITGVILDNARSKDDYPRGYELTVSKDGKQWTSITRKTDNKGGVTEIHFSPTPAKYIRIAQLGSAKGNFWSIHELSILEASRK